MLHRLKEYIDYKGIPIARFEKSIGMSNASFGKSLKNNGTIGADKLEIILNVYTDLSVEWLITGKGDMIKAIRAQVENKHISARGTRIPLVSIAAVGGFGNAEFTIKDSDVKDFYIVPKFKDRRIDFMIEISGSSMQPKYNSGDVVACTIIRESKFLQWNKVHVIGTTEQGILIKRVRKASSSEFLLAVSENKDYEPFEIPLEEIVGIALVVGVIRLE